MIGVGLVAVGGSVGIGQAGRWIDPLLEVLGGAAEVSGVPGLLSVVVRSMVGLLGDVVLVSIVLMLSMVVSGLSFVAVAVGTNVGVTGTGSSWS